MPWHQFKLFLGIALGRSPDYGRVPDPVANAEAVLTDMARWREKHGRAPLPRAGGEA